MRRRLVLALAGVLTATPAGVFALGLGDIQLKSALNQNINAEIELISSPGEDLDSLRVTLADAAVFERYGLDRPQVLTQLEFTVQRRPDGTAYVLVTSREPIREPFLTFLLEANWPRGRLVREYTVLLDPPVLAPAEPVVAQLPVTAETAAPAPAPAPVAPLPEVAAAPAEAVAQPPAPEPVVEPAVVAAEPQPEAPAEAPVAAPAPPPQPEAVQPEPAAPREVVTAYEPGATYGPIRRKETLWAIAKRLRPDESVSINQMMLALYRLNPEAFQGNINRMKAGYVLRLPDEAELKALDRRAAFAEVQRQIDEWRAGRPAAPAPAPAVAEAVPPAPAAEPEEAPLPAAEAPPADARLTLVAPGERATGQVSDDPAARVAQLERELAEARGRRTAGSSDVALEADIRRLERELAEARRLLAVPSETLSQLQAGPEPQPAPAEAAPPAETPVPSEPAASPAPEPPAGQAQPLSAQPPTEAVTPPSKKHEPGVLDTILDNLTSPLVLGGIAAVLLLGLAGAGFMRWQRARAARRMATAPAVEGWLEEEIQAEEEEKTVIAPESSEEEAVTQLREDFEPSATATMKVKVKPAAPSAEAAEKTQVLGRPAEPAPSLVDTLIGGQTVALDENDPISEADFHMAYGLYDQAADLIKKASQREPGRRDLKLKLLEIYFSAGNAGAFVAAAKALRQEMGEKADPDWDKVVIMGKQVAPNDPLFAGAAAGAGAAVDLDFAAAGGVAQDTAVIEESIFTAAPAKPAADETLAFELPGETPPPTPSAPPKAAAPAVDEGLEFDLGDLGFETPAAPAASPAPEQTGMTDTQSEFDKALEELSAFIDTNIPAEEAKAEAGGEISFEGIGVGEEGGLTLEEGEAGGELDTAGEIETKLDLARAYIDMGDPDGARTILQEVLEDGNPEQKKQAQELLAQI